MAQAKTMTDKMIAAGAKKLSEMAPALDDPDEALLPPFGGASSLSTERTALTSADAAKVNFEVALAVVEGAVQDGVAQIEVPKEEQERRKWAEDRRWDAVYPDLTYSKDGIA